MLDQEQEFMAAARELVEGFCQEVLGLFGQEDPADVAGDTVAEMFRRIHSLKGLTAAFDRPAAAGLCHGLEQVLDALRAGRQSLSLDLAKLLLEAADQLQHLVQNPPEERLAETALQPLLAYLAGAAEPAPPAMQVAPEDLGIEKHIAQALTAAEGQRLLQCLAQGRALYQLDGALPLAAMEERGARLRQSLQGVGELLASVPGSLDAAGQIVMHWLLAGRQLETLCDDLGWQPAPVLRRLPIGNSVPLPQVARRRAPAAPPRLVRVEQACLEALQEEARDLALCQGNLLRWQRSWSAPVDPVRAMELDSLLRDLGQGLERLHRALHDARTVPVHFLFERMQRIVRQACLDGNKRIRLELRGGDTALDRGLLEALSEPLTHLLRNAVDHGIEPVTHRRAAGKPEEGRVLIEAGQQGNHFVVAVTDDGGGIEAQQVRARAVERGLLAPELELSRQQIFDLLFLPGFTTRRQVSELSGRGVGLDIVQQHLAGLSGLVELDSTPDSGTTVRLVLPMKRTVLPVLGIKAGAFWYALAVEDVLEVRSLREMWRASGAWSGSLLLRGRPTPLFSLRTFQGCSEADWTDAGYLVVAALGQRQVALVAEAVSRRCTAVLRPFEGVLRRLPGIVGLADPGHDQPLLLLDLGTVIRAAGQQQLWAGATYVS
jgi:two-component system, chemotaxis family, sensor kinase CheA